MSDTVEYREIPGFPGYRVGSDGSVWSRRWSLNKVRHVLGDWRWLNSRPNPDGYPGVTLRRDKKSHSKNVHALVMLAFVGPKPDGMEVAHENGNPADCRLSNLSYKTGVGNWADRYRHGTATVGSRTWNAKATEPIALKIREEFATGIFTKAALARKYRLSESVVRSIIQRKSWKHV